MICERLGIRYPVFQGGMAWIADGKLAAPSRTRADSV
jgi:enoyl-[acyl-carrier protein] reductase II